MKGEVRNVKGENFQTSNFPIHTFSGEWRVKPEVVKNFEEVVDV